MSEKIKIEIIVPSDARYKFNTPYMEYDVFIKYCMANNVNVSKAGLEMYEKNKLLFPCVRLMYPRELLRRRFRTRRSKYVDNFKISDEWKPLIAVEKSVENSRSFYLKEAEVFIKQGHPYDRALKEEKPFIFNPENEKFKSWKRYEVIVGKYGKDESKKQESKAKHYYAPWKIFMVQELNFKNIDEHSRASEVKRVLDSINNKFVEYTPFFNAITSFRCRRNMLLSNYYIRRKEKSVKWSDVQRRTKWFSKDLFLTHKYEEWIRFLRKLIELHESYLKNEKYLLSLEMQSYMASTCSFLGYSKGYKFEKICKDVSGRYIGRLGHAYERGVTIYPGRLEEIFANEEYDLENNIGRVFREDFKRFNDLLGEDEKLGESLADKLFDELKEEHGKVFLVTIGKVSKVLNDPDILWPDNEFWSCILDLSVSIEALGKEWFRGRKIDGIFIKAFPKEYQALQRKTNGKISDADSGKDYIKKLKLLKKNKKLADNKKCGRHLLIARLTRNFSTHKTGLSGNDLHDNFALIYNALVSTLFVLYDSHKLQKESKN